MGLKPVRELLGVMVSESASRAVLVTCGSFTREARLFAEGKPLALVEGPKLWELVQSGKRYLLNRNCLYRHVLLTKHRRNAPIAVALWYFVRRVKGQMRDHSSGVVLDFRNVVAPGSIVDNRSNAILLGRHFLSFKTVISVKVWWT